MINRSSTEIGTCLENVHFFRDWNKKSIILHLGRYGFGNKFRPMLVKELSDMLSHYKWRYINSRKRWNLVTATVWFAPDNNDNKIEILPVRLPADGWVQNKDYFCNIEDIADYFSAIKCDEKNFQS